MLLLFLFPFFFVVKSNEKKSRHRTNKTGMKFITLKQQIPHLEDQERQQQQKKKELGDLRLTFFPHLFFNTRATQKLLL